jgi:glutamine amidotransferase
MNVTVVNYANSNAHSILRALTAIGIQPRFSQDRDDILASDFLILPGVGHTGTALAALRARDLVGPLEEAVFGKSARVLGICLGMQIMVDYVEEGDCPGLGWISGRATSLKVRDRLRYKVPHIGWNTVAHDDASSLLPPREGDRNYYFCHKYSVENVVGAASVATFHYETERVAMFEKSNIFGVQFHPEKSHAAGLALLRRFFKADA